VCTSSQEIRTVYNGWLASKSFCRPNDFVNAMQVCANPIYFVIPTAIAPHLLRQHYIFTKSAHFRLSTVLMLPTRAASAFHAAVHDLRVARLVRLANKNVPTNVSIERFDYAGMMRAVELTRAELLLSGRDVSFQANTAAMKPMMRPLPTPSRQYFAQNCQM